MCCRKMSYTPEPKVQPVVGGGRQATTADGERVRGPGVDGGES